MIKKILKRSGIALGVALAAVAALAVYIDVRGIPTYPPPITDKQVVELTPARIERGGKLASMLCADCHEDTSTHRFTGTHMADLPPMFGSVYSKNITRDVAKGVGGWTDGELRYFLRTGVRPDGTYALPFMVKLPHTSDDDIDAIIAFLRSEDPRVAASPVDAPGVSKPTFLVKALTYGPFKALPYPNGPILAPPPPKSDPVAHGRYLVFSLDCYSCHSADFTKNNIMEPEKSVGFMGGGNKLMVHDGTPIFTANLTSDVETGIGAWTEGDFVRAVKKGFRPDGRALHAPMTPRPELDDDEAAAIYAYLRTVPKIRNAVPRPAAPLALGASSFEGKALYHRYGCVSCHGDSGKGAVGDLHRANESYPTDVELRRWIDEAPSMKPGTKMPGWKGVIAEQDYPPLLAYVRSLGQGNREASNDRVAR